jgi:hypothetical protein
MASALDLGNAPLAAPADPFEIPEEGIGLSDYARSVAAGAYGVAGAVTGGFEYLLNLPAGTDLESARTWARTGAEEQVGRMSKGAQRAMRATVIPGGGDDIWDRDVSTRHAVGLRAAGAIPSLLASIIPGGVVARMAASAGAGMAVGGAAAGLQSGGDVFNQISERLTGTPDAQLQEESDAYRGLRGMGMEEADAKAMLVQQAAGFKPIVMAAITALTSRYGVEGMVAHRAAGEAGRGVLRGTGLGVLGEASQEAVEGLSGELLSQRGVYDAKAGDAGYDWLKALEAAAEGAVVGGVTGGAVGALTSRRRRQTTQEPIVEAPVANPSIQDALVAAAPSAAGIRANDASQDIEAARSTPTPAGHEMARAVEEHPGGLAGTVVAQDAPGTAVVPATPTVDVDQATALVARQERVEQGETIPPLPDAPPVVTPDVMAAITNTITEQVQREQEPAPAAPNPAEVMAGTAAPSPTGAATEPSPVLATPEPAAPETAPAPSPEAPAVVSTAPQPFTPGEPTKAARLLEDLAQKRRARTGTRKTKAKLEQEARGETEILSPREDKARQRQRALGEVADRTRKALGTIQYDRATMNTADAQKAYMRQLVEAANVGKLSMANLPADADPMLRHLVAARALMQGRSLDPNKTAEEQRFDFMVNDLSLRQGADLTTEYAQAQALKSAPTVVEEKEVEDTGGRNLEEERAVRGVDWARGVIRRGREAKAIRREKIQDRAYREQLRREGPIEEETKKPVVEVRKSRVIRKPGDMVKVRKEVEPEPTPAQAEAGNYSKAHVNIHGLDIAIETPKGATRRGKGKGGAEWAVKLKYDYGYVKGSSGADKSQVDVYVGPNPASRMVFIINQIDPDTGKFDEHKAFVGFNSPSEVQDAYRAGFSDGSADYRVGPGFPITPMTVGQFKVWLDKPQRQPAPQDAAATIQAQADVPQPQTEPQAERVLEDVRVAENVDLVTPKGDAFARIDQMHKLLDQLGTLDAGKYAQDLATTVRRYRKKLDGVRWMFENGELDMLAGRADRRSGMLGTGLDGYRSDDSVPAEVREVANKITDLASDLEDIAYGDAPQSDVFAEFQPRGGPLTDRVREKIRQARERIAERKGMITVEGRGKIEAYGAQKLSKAFASVNFKRLNDSERKVFTFMRGVLEPMVGDVTVAFASPEQMNTVLLGSDRRTKGGYGAPRGLYGSGPNVILINDEFKDDPSIFVHLLIHEGSHAALHHSIQDDIMFNSLGHRGTIRHLMQEVEQAYTAKFKGKPGWSEIEPALTSVYGMTNEHEFIAETMSSLEFQEMLAGLKASPELIELLDLKSRSSMWDAFVAIVRRIFMLDPGNITLLDAALRVTENLVADRKATLTHSQRNMDPLPEFSREQVQGMVADKRAGMAVSFRRFGIKVGTVEQLVRQFRDRFEGNVLDRFHDGLARMHKQAQSDQVEAQRMWSRWSEWEKKNPDQARAAADVIMRANIDDVDPRKPMKDDTRLTGDKTRHYQRVARFEALKGDYDALSTEAKALIGELSDYYKREQAKAARALARAALDVHNETAAQKLSEADIDGLVDRTVNGQLTTKDKDNPTGKSDEEVIGNENTFKALSEAAEMRLARGMYFPMMRHGDFVVRTKDRLPDLMGGVVHKQDDKTATIRFTAPKQKDAKAAYKAWAKSKGMLDGPTITSRRIVRIMNGQEVDEATARGHPHDVVYEVTVQTQGLYTFDSAAEAARFIREQSGNFQTIDPTPLNRADPAVRGDLTSSQLAGLMGAVDRRDDIAAGTKQLMKATIGQAAIQMMPGNRIQHRSLKRRGVRGSSEDIGRNLLNYSRAAAQNRARVEHMKDVRQSLTDMRKQIGEVGDEDASGRSTLVRELEDRVYKNTLDPQASPRFVQDLMALSYLDKLFSPMYSVVNAMQPWMVTAPYLGGLHGNLRAGAALSVAYNDVGAGRAFVGGIANTGRAAKGITKFDIDTSDLIGSIQKNLAKKDDGARLNELITKATTELGLIDDASGQEIAGDAAVGRGKGRRALSAVDRIARQLPLAVETVNRSVTLVAAYRLAYATTGNHETSMQAAIDALNQTQFNYDAWNQPTFFNHPYLRPALQFKKFAQGMTALMADMVQRAFKGDTPQVKRQAWKQLANIFAIQIAMAGAMGLPGLELVKAGAMLAAVLGLGEGWGDMERRLRKLADDSMGKEWGERVMKGVVSRSLGVDISSRVGLADMWLFGEPKSNDAEGAWAYFGRLIGGAPVGMAMEWGQGINQAAKGEFWQAAEKMVPVKFVSDTMGAVRGRTDETAKTPLSTGEAFMKSMGLRSARVAERGDEIGRSVATRKQMEEKSKALQNEYLSARTAVERVKVKQKIVAHNRKVEEMKLGMRQKVLAIKTLDGIRERRKNERRAVVGE